MLTTVGMQYEVISGKEEEFERGFIGVIEVLKTLPGHIESHMYEDVQSVGSYADSGYVAPSVRPMAPPPANDDYANAAPLPFPHVPTTVAALSGATTPRCRWS